MTSRWVRTRRQFLRNSGLGLLGASVATRFGWAAPQRAGSEVEPRGVIAALGEGAISFLFDADVPAFVVGIEGGNGGTAALSFFARDGSLVSLDARFVLREIGIELPPEAGATDLKRHPELLQAADLVLAMTDEQRAILLVKFPDSEGKDVVLVRELVGEAGDIDDPSMKDEDVFRFCRNEIVRCLEGGLDRLLARLEG